MTMMNAYLDRLTLAARSDAVLAQQFLRVAGFIDPPESFFKPSIVWRVLRGTRAARRGYVAVRRQTSSQGVGSSPNASVIAEESMT